MMRKSRWQQLCLFTIFAMFSVTGLAASTESMVTVQACSMASCRSKRRWSSSCVKSSLGKWCSDLWDTDTHTETDRKLKE